jgi:protein TonB
MQAPPVELRRAGLDEPVSDRAPAIVLDLGNVVPFVRPNARSADHDLPAQINTASERPVPQTLDQRDQRLLIALLLSSFAIHVAVLALLWRPAPPLPGIELATMEVEIIVSDASRASPSAGEAAPSPTPDEQQPAKQEPDASPPTPQATQPPPEQAAESTPVEPQLPPPEQPQQQALAPPEQPQQVEPAPVPPQVIAPPEQIEKTPTEVAPPPPPQIKPEKAQQPPTPSQHKAPPREAKPQQEAAPKSRATSNAQKATAGAKPSAGAPARKTNADPNYSGKVFAHLARFKRMPPDAQKNRSQGTARVRFVIDGRGNVGSVQLVGSSGVASLDQEALAWPRRASPFPPPPGGQSIPITAPVSFHF